MKKILLIFSVLSICTVATAQTIKWYVGDQVYHTSICENGSSVTPPTPPEKYGYHFTGWETTYIPVEYIESDGAQYIDTGYRFGGNTKVIFKANWTVLPKYLFGANSGGGEQLLQYNSGYLMGRSYSFSPTIKTNTDTFVEMQMYQRDSFVTINNTRVFSTTSEASNTKSIYLFAVVNSAAANDNTAVGLKMKIYYFKLYKEGVLVRDFVPALDHNNVPCMYDNVTRQFFYNGGTGEFTAGSIVGE